MGTVYARDKVLVRVNLRDHLPPHFHIIGVDDDCLVEIETLRIIEGTLPSRDALKWATDNIAIIRAEWNRLYPDFQV